MPESQSFRSDWRPLTKLTLLGVGTGAFVGASAVSILQGHSLALAIVSAVVAAPFAAIFMLPLAWLVIAYFRVYTSPAGLRCYDAWGRYHDLPWDSIQNVKPISIAGARYLRVSSSTTQGTAWVPLFLQRQADFASEVRAFAGADNPLSLHLRSEAA